MPNLKISCATIRWSPDGKKIAFIGEDILIRIFTLWTSNRK